MYLAVNKYSFGSLDIFRCRFVCRICGELFALIYKSQHVASKSVETLSLFAKCKCIFSKVISMGS